MVLKIIALILGIAIAIFGAYAAIYCARRGYSYDFQILWCVGGIFIAVAPFCKGMIRK